MDRLPLQSRRKTFCSTLISEGHTMIEDRSARVRRKAYERWEREGRPEGRDTEHWLEAERELEDADAEGQGAQSGISNHRLGDELCEQEELPSRMTRNEPS